MKHIDLLYQNYAAEQLAKGRTIQQRKIVKICSLPEDYFDEYKQRQKPFLRLVHSENICKENVGF